MTKSPLKKMVIPKHDWQLEAKHKEKNLSPSVTIVGEAYTIEELLHKHTKGLMPNVAKDPIWQEDATLDDMDLNKLSQEDIFTKEQLKEDVKTAIKEQTTVLKEAKSQRAQSRKKEEQLDSTQTPKKED